MADPAAALRNERVAIVGVGGTGSHVLDYVSKAGVEAIHVFDDDRFLPKNALRSPGPFDKIPPNASKATFHGARYATYAIGGVRAFDERIHDANVARLGDYDTVFLCIDGGTVKRRVVEVCMANNVLLIDTGMGVYRRGSALAGTLRVTTATPGDSAHVERCVGLDEPAADRDLRNNQSVELNALNAALAVIKWKQLRGVFEDSTRELHCVYDIGQNRIYGRFERSEGT